MCSIISLQFYINDILQQMKVNGFDLLVDCFIVTFVFIYLFISSKILLCHYCIYFNLFLDKRSFIRSLGNQFLYIDTIIVLLSSLTFNQVIQIPFGLFVKFIPQIFPTSITLSILIPCLQRESYFLIHELSIWHDKLICFGDFYNQRLRRKLECSGLFPSKYEYIIQINNIMKKFQDKKLINKLFTPQKRISSAKLQQNVKIAKNFQTYLKIEGILNYKNSTQAIRPNQIINEGNIKIMKKIRVGTDENIQNLWNVWKNLQNNSPTQKQNFVQKIDKQIQRESQCINKIKNMSKKNTIQNKIKRYYKNNSQFIVNDPNYDHLEQYISLKHKEQQRTKKQNFEILGRRIKNKMLRIQTNCSDELIKKNSSRFLTPKYNKIN